VLRVSLETDSRLRQYVEDALKAHDAAPSWKGTSIKHFIGFFDRWLFSDVDPRDPGFFIGEYSALTQTKSGKALHTYLPFHMWFLIFLESRHEYLDSPGSTSNLPDLVTWAPKHGEGFDMQMLPATRGGNAGPSEKGTPYQLRLVKRYKLMDKLIAVGKTNTISLPKAVMVRLYRFRSFEEFFLRRFLPGTRPIAAHPPWWDHKAAGPSASAAVIAPADGKIKWLFHEPPGATKDARFILKAKEYSLREVFSVCSLGAKLKCTANQYLDRFMGGPVIDTLLWFTDYHRYHAPVSGKVIVVQDFGTRPGVMGLGAEGPSGVAAPDRKWLRKKALAGPNSHLRLKKDMSPGFQWYLHLSKHRRSVIIFDTDVRGGSHVGIVMMMPIGFYGVGSMVTRVSVGDRVKRGQEVGNFSFGGSSIILSFEKDKVNIGLPYLPSKYPFPRTSSKFMSVKVRQAIATRAS